MATKHASNDEDRLTVGAAAALLGVHPQTLRNYESAGWITATRTPGGERRFRRGDVVQLRENPPADKRRNPREAAGEAVA